MSEPQTILVAGPTASGKSNLAAKIAKKYNGEIINADSMQVYNALKVLTARPNENEGEVPHHLYGYVSPDEEYNVAKWLKDATKIMNQTKKRGKVPIFVGGTGLYFKALTEGLSDVPDIPKEIRQEIRGQLKSEGAAALYERLKKLDPSGAEKLKQGDSHRIARALEVVVATKKPASVFKNNQGRLVDDNDKNVMRVLVMVDRKKLYEKINQRTKKMIKDGAVEETKKLLSLNLNPDAPILSAIGVKTIQKYLNGEIDMEQVISTIQTDTRRYAKRQYTWFNNQFDSTWSVNPEII